MKYRIKIYSIKYDYDMGIDGEDEYSAIEDCIDFMRLKGEDIQSLDNAYCEIRNWETNDLIKKLVLKVN